MTPENEQRFWPKVKIPAVQPMVNCWEWQAAVLKSGGYGAFRMGRVTHRAHRVAYEIATGANPGSLFVCHRCDNPLCVNPLHLFLGSNAENVRDMLSKKRQPSGALKPNAKITDTDVREIRRLAALGMGHREIGRRFGICSPNVSMISTRRRWRHVS